MPKIIITDLVRNDSQTSSATYTAAMIRVDHLRKTFGSTRAVDGISFEVRRGETFGLLGPNGAGKTTTLHMLVGLLKPDAGDIHIDGATDPTRPRVRRSIGLAPQTLSLYEDMTATENLKFFGRLYGLRDGRLSERVAQAIEQAGLADRSRHLVKTYSGGMKRRLHLACALLHQPQVLLLDEPTLGVDPQARLHILEDIEQLGRQGRTILFTTHYIEEAQKLCNRVAIMDHGRILAMDTVSAMIDCHGGQAVVHAELDEAPPGDWSLPGRLNGTSLSAETDHPFETVRRWAASGIRIRSLSIERPSLETVFLRLTGRRLRD
ncbi:MAG TPA: ABC transporter ATP-binding protein [Phycisphaerae bacterium]|nr:ABC transporter ATP-binding protein [Phycisphaerae bacterium]